MWRVIPLSVLQMPGLMAELNLECLAPGQGTLRHGVPNKREPGASIMGPLNDLVAERLPRVELAEVLIEVDSWTGFTQFFRHAGGARSRNPDLVRHVYAAILAQACNFGLTTMADIADLTYRQLAWTTDWYLREETLKAAFSALVDFQHQLPLAEAWGGGTLSSSDGQRFPVRGSAENAPALPKYFGLGRGLTFYTWTSDQYSQYGSKVISSTVRDATYGIQGEDLVIIRALLEATRKLEHKLRRGDFDCRTLVFLRNDIFELLVGETPDRGKESKVVLDWTDEDLLREMLRRRLVYNDAVQDDTPFEDVWRAIAVSHVDGEESSQFVIERSLMRPRALLDLVIHCRSVAINLRHKKIETEDFKKGLAAYSSDLLSEVSLEIRDVLPAAEDVLYEFIDSSARLSTAELSSLLDKVSTSEVERKEFVELLLWYGALGVVRLNGDVTFIYSVNYDMKRLKGIISKLSETGVMYVINPAFGAALEVKS